MNRLSQFARSCAAGAILFAAPLLVHAQTVPSNLGSSSSTMPLALQNVGFEPTLNAAMPLDLPFKDETGRDVKLGDYFGTKPVVLAFVYYSCPMLCEQVQQGVVGSLRMLSFAPGSDYQVVFISFDPKDTPVAADAKKQVALSHFRHNGTPEGWHFLSGTPAAIEAATRAANFRYKFDEKSGLFAHASGVLILTPDGHISRYFYGVEYPGRDMRLGLVDASAGKIGSPIDHVLLFCYHYDPTSATYSAAILKLVRLGGILTVLCFVGGILFYRRRDIAQARARLELAAGSHSERGAH